MKIFRRIYYTLMAVSLLGGLINGLRPYFIVFMMMLFVLLLSLGMNLWTILSFKYSQTMASQRAVKGQTLSLKIRIFNEKPYPFTMMKINTEAGRYKDPVKLEFNLESKSHIEFEIPVHCRYRGEFELGMTTVEIWDMFGLIPITFDMRRLRYYKMLPLLVYPNIDIIQRLPAFNDDTKNFSNLRLTAAEAGDNFAQARLYQQGDASKRIHWKMSARHRELFTKQYEIPLETHSLVVVDNRDIGLEGESALVFADLVCECAASLIRYALYRGHPVKTIQCDESRPPLLGNSVADFTAIYDWLAVLPFDAHNGITEVLNLELRESPDIRVIYLITSRPGQELEQLLRQRQSGGGEVVCIVVSADAEPDAVRVPVPGVKTVFISSGEDIESSLGEAL